MLCLKKARNSISRPQHFYFIKNRIKFVGWKKGKRGFSEESGNFINSPASKGKFLYDLGWNPQTADENSGLTG